MNKQVGDYCERGAKFEKIEELRDESHESINKLNINMAKFESDINHIKEGVDSLRANNNQLVDSLKMKVSWKALSLIITILALIITIGASAIGFSFYISYQQSVSIMEMPNEIVKTLDEYFEFEFDPPLSL